MHVSRLPKSTARVATCVFTALAGLALSVGPAAAAGSAYPEWTLGGGTGGGTMTMPAVGFPAATVTTDSTNPTVPSGTSAWLGPNTPFGARYGTSRGHGYLALRTAQGLKPSTTTLTFAAPPPVGWGFALGDIDADRAHLSAIGADGSLLTAAQLGFQSVFNYCLGSPLPSACGGRADTDLPTFYPADPGDPSGPALIGSGADTSGASGWFRPTVPVKSLSIEFKVLTGIPLYQLWVATNTYSISGLVTESGPCPPAHVDPLILVHRTGTPVTTPDGQTVHATAGPDGSYSFPEVAAGDYRVEAAAPVGRTAVSGTSRTANATNEDVSGVDFTFHCAPAVQPPTVAPEDGSQVIPLDERLDPDKPITVIDQPDHGTATYSNGALVYTPNVGYTGTDSFVYTGETYQGTALIVTVSLTVAKTLPATGIIGLDTMLEWGSGLLIGGLALRTVAARRKREP